MLTSVVIALETFFCVVAVLCLLAGLVLKESSAFVYAFVFSVCSIGFFIVFKLLHYGLI